MSVDKGVHLLVLMHGLWGTPSDLTHHMLGAEAAAKEAHLRDPTGPELHVFRPSLSAALKTFDGIDVCASRAAWEVVEEVERLGAEGRLVEEVTFLGYSMGGLIVRYMIGLLHATSPSFFQEHKCRPRSFTTLATPNMGIPRYSGSLFQRAAEAGGCGFVGRSGLQLYLKDEGGDGAPSLIESLVDEGGMFMSALALFPNALIFANTCQDSLVRYPTSTFSLDDPFIELPADHHKELALDVTNDHLITKWCTRYRERGQTASSPQPKRPGSLFWPSVMTFKKPWMVLLWTLSPLVVPALWSVVVGIHCVAIGKSHFRIRRLDSVKGSYSESHLEAGWKLRKEGISPRELREICQAWKPDFSRRSSEATLVEKADFAFEKESAFDGDISLHKTYIKGPPPATPDLSLDTSDFYLGGTQCLGQVSPMDRKLHLKPAQHRMAAAWARATSKRDQPVRTYLTHWPYVHNAHATIVMRNWDTDLFPDEALGKPVVRKWADFVING